ncbi:hypothetical protein BS78_K091300 [Paspalum vaginatum]|uniref:FBD domain-containing protein n=1 Tax=Paspalum vaginatum TaxID=158149 RepID=A0A9W8CE10_9POAL|nr:hypothetical protein BS78_K091300 [Paspalum vaginatum]
MRLALNYELRLSADMKFTSLTDLSLERIKIPPGDLHLLARLVSTESCPRLQKLRMVHVCLQVFHHEEMWLQETTDVLPDAVEDDANVRSLELRTPGLQALHILSCNPEVMLCVSVPRLEELALPFEIGYTRCVKVDGDLTHVRSLKICLWSYYPRVVLSRAKAVNDASKRHIKLCTSVTCLDVTLCGRKISKDDQQVEILKSMIPHLPCVTSLTVNVSPPVGRRDFGASVATLLTRFRNLRCLSKHLPFYLMGLKQDECHHPDHWISNEISMSHLQEVEFTGLTGTDCELWLMKAMLTSAKKLHKVDISFHPDFCQNKGKIDAFEHMLHGEGMWTSHRDTLKLIVFR